MKREPAVKKVLYWCDQCNVPLIGRTCACGARVREIPLLQPHDLRPALAADMALIRGLLTERFGNVPLPRVVLLNKTGGVDRADLVIAHGDRLGWLTFDPIARKFSLDIAPEALPHILPHVTRGIIDLEAEPAVSAHKGRIGGKQFPLAAPVPDGTVIVSYKSRFGTGVVRDGQVRVKELVSVEPRSRPDPGWDTVIEKNRYHLKNLERNAVRTIKKHMNDRPCVNVSFSGGKDSTAVLHLARRAGVENAFFIDTGLELPETVEFAASQGVEIIRKGGDFFQAVEKAGPPGKDHRWCCKLLKLQPLKIYLAGLGPCVTIQGNRWYESWNRADLDETSQNPANPLQLNVSPIRNWRALEVFLYLWWREVPMNPLYEMGLERVGCYLCPAVLESEYEGLREMHPELTDPWDEFLIRWAEKNGLPDAYHRWGLWRWRALPPKMREVCRDRGIAVNDDFTLREAPVRKVEKVTTMKSTGIREPVPPAENESVPDMIRKDFPILGDIVYLDNAATTFSPEPVVEALVEFEHRYRANVGRGVHRLTRIATQRYWHAHEKVARFIGGEAGVTVFTKNATDAINMVAQGLSWKPGDRVATTILEHHSNLLPWRALAKQGVALDVIGIDADYSLDLAALEKTLAAGGVRLVAVTHASNVLGVTTPVREIAALCREHGALLLVDGAQSLPHMPVNVADLGCDILCFAGHKMFGPTGTGVLWMRDLLIEPAMLGGGMVASVSAEGYVPAEGYQRYEAGTPNVGGGIALGAAVDYLSGIGMEKIHRHEERLTARLIEGLSGIDGVTVYAGRKPGARIGVVSFTIDGVHPQEAAQMLDEDADILVRSGHHCCQPLMEHLNLPEGTVRASMAAFTTEQEIDLLIAAVDEISRGR
ncbi:aminotransferase class V-fold PLP-dependent enzyme [Methanoculleus horonobensis]|uniref:aminotransferase class V-fold PLP-dependent enzyme n=1 Tax=Methanoculleus horonobensis TaxID=528314 RepID=UPI0008303E96|nr:aminotransferase class V-fold PLP-dependent enzyme [Methanoculleus horonobensis]MDD3070794.1 aminotransferase class V-fold PLP-dependent enzyme [Methanoculleus horonobensis]